MEGNGLVSCAFQRAMGWEQYEDAGTFSHQLCVGFRLSSGPIEVVKLVKCTGWAEVGTW